MAYDFVVDGLYIPGFGPTGEGDPSLGVDVDFSQSNLRDQHGNTGVRHFTPEDLAPNNGSPTIFLGHGGRGTAFATSDPQELADLRDDQQTRMQQGAVKIAGMILGANAAVGNLGGGAGAGSGSATVSASDAAAGAAATPAYTGPVTAAGLPTGAAAAAGGGAGAMTGAIPAVGAGGTVAAALPATRGIGSFLSKNKDIIGSVIGGIGQGIATDRAADAEADLLQKRHDLTSSNYAGTDPGRTFRGLAPGTSTVSPMERFDKYSGWHFEYDSKAGKMVKVPDEPIQPRQQ